MPRSVVAVARLIGVVLLLVIGLSLVAVLFPLAHPSLRAGCMQAWSATLLRLLGINRSLFGIMPPESEEPTLLVANHVSWLDIVALMSVGATAFVAKREVRAWPLIGWMAERTGTVFTTRSQRLDIARINRRVSAQLGSGVCVAVFPEGTTTDGTTLLEFHSGLFEAARDSAARIWPVAIRYAHCDGSLSHAADFVGEASLISSLWRVVNAPALCIHLAFAAPLSTRGSHRREAAGETRRRIAALLGLAHPAPPISESRRLRKPIVYGETA
jgi:1-acyl-sn-glycerol-3-phosphate acyltransferase